MASQTVQPGRYLTYPPTKTVCYIVNCVNVVNIDACYLLSANIASRYLQCIMNEVEYVQLDPNTLKPGPTIVDVSYRSRLKGITITGNTFSSPTYKKKLLEIATIEMRSHILRTGGIFTCIISDVDVYRRILVELFDPITGDSINQSILSKYQSVMSKYGNEWSSLTLDNIEFPNIEGEQEDSVSESEVYYENESDMLFI